MVSQRPEGWFNKFEGTIQSEEEDFSDAQVELSIDANSVDTHDAQRDGHLSRQISLIQNNSQLFIFKVPTWSLSGTINTKCVVT